MPALRIREPGEPRRLIHLENLPATLGRGGDAAVCLRGDLNISKIHARIIKTDSGYVVEDLDSRNGVIVYGRREARALLRHGAIMTIGSTKVEFLIHDIPAPESDASHAEVERDAPADPSLPTAKQGKKRRRGRRRNTLPSTAAAATTSRASRSSGPLLLAVFAALGIVTLLVVSNLRRSHRDEIADPVAPEPLAARAQNDPDTDEEPRASRGQATPPAHAESARPATERTARVLGNNVSPGRATRRMPTNATREPTQTLVVRRSTEWSPEVLRRILGRDPSSEESRAVYATAHALPSDLFGRLTIAAAVVGASNDSTRDEAAEQRLASLFTTVTGRTPSDSQSSAIRAALERGYEREAHIAIASLPHGRPVPPLESRTGETGVVVACVSVVDVDEVFGSSPPSSRLRRMARRGVTALDLDEAGASPLAAIRSLLGNVNSPASNGLVPSVSRASGGESWVVVGDASRWSALAHATSVEPRSPETFLWSLDASRHPVIRTLTATFGQPVALDPEAWSRIRSLRSALGAAPSDLEIVTARSVTEPGSVPGVSPSRAIERLLGERRPRLVTTILEDTLDGSADANLESLETLVSEIGAALSSKSGWIAVVSPGGRPSAPGSPGSGFVLASGGPFRSGRIVRGPNSLADVRTSILRALDLPGLSNEDGISRLFSRSTR